MKKKLLFTLLALIGFVSGAWADGYRVGFDTSLDVSTVARRINSVKLNDDTKTLEEDNKMYRDLHETVVFEVAPGATVTPGFVLNGGGWMHGLVYVDLNQNGDFATYDGDSFTLDDGENVANSASTGTLGSTFSCGSFTAPTTVGDYRMRFKADWNGDDPRALNPAGRIGNNGTYANNDGNSIVANSGSIVDVTLRVTEDLSICKTSAISTLNTCYLASSSLISTSTTNINNATSAQEVNNALATALSAYQTEVAGKIWFVRNALPNYYSNQNVYKCLAYNGTKIVWATEDIDNPNCYLKIEVNNENKLLIKTMEAKYMQGVSGAVGVAVSANSPVTLRSLGDGQFNLNFPDGTAHTEGHNSGAGITGDLVNWAGDANSASSWVFVEANADDYTNAVALAEAEALRAAKMYHPTTRTTSLNGTYMIYNAADNGGSQDRSGMLKSPAGTLAHSGSHDFPITFQGNYEYLFEITPASVENGYYVKSVKNNKYISGTNASSSDPVVVYIQPWATTTASKGVSYAYDMNREVVNADVIADGLWTVSNEDGSTCWNGNQTSFATWENAHPIVFYNVVAVEDGITAEMLTIAQAYAQHKVDQNAPHTTTYGTFTESTMTSVNTLAVGNTFEQYVTAVNNTSETTVATPEKGSFIRIKGGVSGKYISGAGTTANAQALLTEDDAESILWYSAEGELIGYQSGLGFINTHSVAAYNATKEKQTFGAGNASDKLTILSNYSGSKALYDNSTKLDRTGAATAANNNWIVSDVESLPVALSVVGEHSYSTFYSPVAVTLPSEVQAYVVTVDQSGDHASLTLIESGVVPANTGVVLYSKTGATSANLTIGGEAGSVTSALTGSAATIAKVECATLQNGANGVGLYSYNGETLKGFKAYLPASSGVKSLVFNFDEETIINGIAEAEQKAGAIYDMSGRQVNKALKGVYIQNGKKFIVK